ncbi:MAG: hypothetical protein ACR2QC_08005 [Gammaproteobacteria bacterium]
MTQAEKKLARNLDAAAQGRRAGSALELIEEVLTEQQMTIIARISEAYKTGTITPDKALAFCADLAAVDRLRRDLSRIAQHGVAASRRVHGKTLTGNGEHA